ncbi:MULTISPECIES: MCE family protein [Nocardioides]|uniref:MCE family protein n=1 Tax=Nocardioides vastitatis TaxID=2568655 RepID=A0ABW0ZJA1_9ACTN|nr:MCE family protein [Nocardioides sp.]THJ13495.1 MCE family protein [Nocardioides sp.]
MSTLRQRLRWIVLLLLGSVLLAGCDFDVYKLPLPGGADTGDDPLEVYVEFADVLDLVPKSSVKVNEVTVGQVTDVELRGYTARVTIEVRRDVNLPDNATASIRQTSLLGEKFVSLDSPPSPTSGKLGDQDTIPISRTGRNPEVEEVLGALSLVLNGGGVAQMKTIAAELNLALEGREDAAKSVFTQLDSLVSQLDDRKADIVNAIESLNRLAITARTHQKSIDLALDELPSALDSLDRQRDDLVLMLDGLSKLGDVGVRVINATHASTVSSLKALDPVLTQIANAGDDFANAFSTFLTFPFIDETVGRDPVVADNLHMGDYVNLSVDMQLDVADFAAPDVACLEVNELPDGTPLDQLAKLKNLCAGATKAIQQCRGNNLAACTKLPGYLAQEICNGTALKQFCAGGGARAGSGSQDPIENLLGSALQGGGLGRPAPGGTSESDRMWAEFDRTYDVDLVDLYAGPMLYDERGAGK